MVKLPIRAVVFAVALLALAQTWARAGLSVDVSPEPPNGVSEPGDEVLVSWDVDFQSEPELVAFYLVDPSHTIRLDLTEFPGSTGLHVSRCWVVPPDLAPGKYWFGVEYFAVGIGLQAVSETSFLVLATSGVPELPNVDGDPGALPPGDASTPGPPPEETSWGRVKSIYHP